MDTTKIMELDLYEILGIDISSSESEIKKAYRKKALQCHPDKNPDNPNASKEFHQLSAILEILTDESARKAYDKVLRARKEAVIRNQQLDGKRRKLKEDLEKRERLAGESRKYGKQKSDEELLREEIERLRKEGSKAVEEEMEKILQELNKAKNVESDENSKQRIKVKWNASKNDETNGGYTEQMLRTFFSKYGDVSALVISPKKKGSALVEFTTKRAAEMAVQLEIGLPSNPFKLEWINQPTASTQYKSETIKESDYESVVLTRMRQAEERKRLIEQMIAEDNET